MPISSTRVEALLLGLVSVAGSLGCRAQPPSGPELRRVSTVVLHEKDSAYVAGPISFAISEGGDFIVVDKFSRRGYRFNRKGDLLLVYGRPGQGPGELEMPFQSFASGDTLLGIIDDAKQSVQVYDARTGRFVRSRRYDGYIGSTLVVGNTVFLGGTNAARERGLKRWDLAADSLTYLAGC